TRAGARRVGDVDDASRPAGLARRSGSSLAVRVLVTGASGQIGTNLALRLLSEGHWVFGVDKRENTWTQPDDFRYILQDLAIPYPAFRGGIGGVQDPHGDAVVHLPAHAQVPQPL